MKICSACRIGKPLDAFYRNSIQRDGYQNQCKDCVRALKQRYKERYRYREWHRTYHLKQAYGLTIEEYNALLEKQGGVCAICKQPETRKHGWRGVSMLAVDHDHSTGAIRGLLCTKCNTAIGSFEDDLELMTRAMEYLQRAISHAKVAQLPLFGDEE